MKTKMKMINLLIYLLIFLLPLIFSGNVHSAFDLVKTTFFEGMVILLGFLWMIRISKEGRIFIRRNSLNLPVLGFFVMCVIATVFSINSRVSFWGLYNFYFWGFATVCGYVMLFCVIVNNLEERDIPIISNLIILTSLFAAVYGILQYFGIRIFHNVPLAKGQRIWSTFGNATYFATFLAVGIPFTWTKLIQTERRGIQIIFGAISGILFFSLLLTLTRAAWVSLFGAAVVFAYVLNKFGMKKRKFTRFLTILLLYLCIFSVTSVSVKLREGSSNLSPVIKRVRSFTNKSDLGIRGRLAMWRIASKMVKDRPLLGSGLDSFYLLFPSYRDLRCSRTLGNNINAAYTHDEFIQIAVSAGLIGLGIYIWLWSSLFHVARKVTKEGSKYRDVLMPFVLAGVVIFIQNLFAFNPITTSVYFWVIAGIIGFLEFKILKEKAELSFSIRKKGWIPGIVSIVLIFMTIIVSRPILADIIYQEALNSRASNKLTRAVRLIEKSTELAPMVQIYRATLNDLYRDLAKNSRVKKERELLLKNAVNVSLDNVSNYPLGPYGYVNLATAYMWQFQMCSEDTVEKAISSLKKALSIDPYFVEAWHNLGRIYGLTKKFPLAIDYYKRALEIFPDSFGLRYGLGYVFADAGMFKEAEKELVSALKLKPGDLKTMALLQNVKRSQKRSIKKTRSY